jgi:D-lactate dehydrogenase (cytochrome)
VVFSENTQDVADAVQLAARFKVPVIPFGVGPSLEGHLLALQEADAGAIAMMRAIKQALDPGNVMNPGKIFR